jgi:hypothetical protein
MHAAPVILDYQQHKRRLLGINGSATITAVILLPMYYAALVPSIVPSITSLPLNWNENESWWRGGRGIFLMQPREAFADMSTSPRLWFIPFGIVVTALFVFVFSYRLKFLIATTSILVPPVLSGLPTTHWAIIPFYGPILFLQSLAGLCDGEDWSEGYVALGVMAAWMVMWIIMWCLALRHFDRSPLEAHSSQRRDAGTPEFAK